MPFRNLIADPDTMAILASAFDEAWIAIGPGIDPQARSANRELLGAIVLEAWRQGGTDMLAARAVIKFKEGPPAQTPMGR